MNMRAYLVLFAFGVVLAVSTPARTAEVSKKIDESTARKLAAYANDGSLKYMERYSYEGDDSKMTPPFYAYDGLNAPANGSFGFFAVNPWTGDVWALWGCQKLSTPASIKLQSQLRQRFTAEEMKHYAELSELKPDCIFERQRR